MEKKIAPNTILVIDDMFNVQQLLTDFLSSKGYKVTCASNGRDAQIVLKKQTPDLILLDIMMPHMDGYAFITKLRETSNLPVIMITAKQQEEDLVKGFELGADDYITKPFKLSELLVRIKAVLKRTAPDFSQIPFLRVSDMTLDIKNCELKVADRIVELTMAEIEILNILMRSVEQVVAKADLCSHLISQGFSGSESTLKIHIRNLRNKLEPYVGERIVIESVFGVGYRLRSLS